LELAADGTPKEITASDWIMLEKDKTVMLAISGKDKTHTGTEKIKIPYKVKNLLVGPDEGLHVELEVNVKFIGESNKP
jgi:hypothetical protein